MASSQDSVASLVAAPHISEPSTPQLSHASLPVADATAANVAKLQSTRVEDATNSLTPPPSSQEPLVQIKARTPTPTFSHISTPPPTVDASSQGRSRLEAGSVVPMTAEEIASASPEDLRAKVAELQASFKEAKMSAAHHKLQYQMLSQESAASIERMAVEAKMAQYENDVLQNAEQTRNNNASTDTRAVLQEGMIPVQKDLYQHMCAEIQRLTNATAWLEQDHHRLQRTIALQENEISTLDDKVTLLRDRIRETRDSQPFKYRRVSGFESQSQPHSVFATPSRRQHHPYRAPREDTESSQPFAALLQASEMASQAAAARRPSAAGKKSHMRNTHSLSSLPPVTPQRKRQAEMTANSQNPMYYTPQIRQASEFQQMKFPSTAPQPRTSNLRVSPTHDFGPSLYTPSPLARHAPTAGSDGTVSASGSEADSEAETEIISPTEDIDTVRDSQASRAAAQMLRGSQEQRERLSGSGMLSAPSSQQSRGSFKQTKLFGAVTKKRGYEEDGETKSVEKKQRVEAAPIGLGISRV